MALKPYAAPCILLSHRPESRQSDHEESHASHGSEVRYDKDEGVDDDDRSSVVTLTLSETQLDDNPADFSYASDLDRILSLKESWSCAQPCDDRMKKVGADGDTNSQRLDNGEDHDDFSSRPASNHQPDDASDTASLVSRSSIDPRDSRFKKRVSFNEENLVNIFEIPSRQSSFTKMSSREHKDKVDKGTFPHVHLPEGFTSPRLNRKPRQHNAKAGIPLSNMSRAGSCDRPAKLGPSPRIGGGKSSNSPRTTPDLLRKKFGNRDWILGSTIPSILQRPKPIDVKLKLSHGASAVKVKPFMSLTASRKPQSTQATRENLNDLQIKGDSVTASSRSERFPEFTSQRTFGDFVGSETKSAGAVQPELKLDSQTDRRLRAWQIANGIRVHTPSISPLFDNTLPLSS